MIYVTRLSRRFAPRNDGVARFSGEFVLKKRVDPSGRGQAAAR